MIIQVNPHQTPDSNQVLVTLLPENDGDVRKMCIAADKLKDLGVHLQTIKIGEFEISQLSFRFNPKL